MFHVFITTGYLFPEGTIFNQLSVKIVDDNTFIWIQIKSIYNLCILGLDEECDNFIERDDVDLKY